MWQWIYMLMLTKVGLKQQTSSVKTQEIYVLAGRKFNLGPLCEIIDFRHHFLKFTIWCVKHRGNFIIKKVHHGYVWNTMEIYCASPFFQRQKTSWQENSHLIFVPIRTTSNNSVWDKTDFEVALRSNYQKLRISNLLFSQITGSVELERLVNLSWLGLNAKH